MYQSADLAHSTTASENGSSRTSSTREDSNSVNSSTNTAATGSKYGILDQKDGIAMDGDGGQNGAFQPQYWNPPQFGSSGCQVNSDGVSTGHQSSQLQRPHTSGGYQLQHPAPPHMNRLSHQQTLSPLDNPAFHLFPHSNMNVNGHQPGQSVSYQSLSGPAMHQHHGMTRRLWPGEMDRQGGGRLLGSPDERLQFQAQSQMMNPAAIHARSNSLGANGPSENVQVFGPQDANSCCWGLVNCEDGELTTVLVLIDTSASFTVFNPIQPNPTQPNPFGCSGSSLLSDLRPAS